MKFFCQEMSLFVYRTTKQFNEFHIYQKRLNKYDILNMEEKFISHYMKKIWKEKSDWWRMIFCKSRNGNRKLEVENEEYLVIFEAFVWRLSILSIRIILEKETFENNWI